MQDEFHHLRQKSARARLALIDANDALRTALNALAEIGSAERELFALLTVAGEE